MVTVQMEIYAAATRKRMRRFRFYVQRSIAQALDHLLQAPRDSDIKALRSLIEGGETGLDVVSNESYETAFSIAWTNGYRRVCLYLMEKATRIDGACLIISERQTALVAAALTGDVDFVRPESIRVTTCSSCSISCSRDTVRATASYPRYTTLTFKSVEREEAQVCLLFLSLMELKYRKIAWVAITASTTLHGVMKSAARTKIVNLYVFISSYRSLRKRPLAAHDGSLAKFQQLSTS